ncbi:MAG: cellobiose phosphorylase [Candidatus Omnitrophica bacterium]|nr:cellobiose phosphorylase [Candidatus Omnitrophota bacterium]
MDQRSELLSSGDFQIKKYNSAFPFSNFLPGIAGPWGVPMWVFYVNRGQGIISFGIQDKDHSITEFYPANKAYWLTSTIGFRTFVKTGQGEFCEPFKVDRGTGSEEMLVKSDSLEISERDERRKLEFRVRYCTLPNAPVGALIRELRIKNLSNRSRKLEILDGLPRIIPFGASDGFLKGLSRTIEAWMHAETRQHLSTFRLIVDPQDVSQTTFIEGANFHCAFYDDAGTKKYPELIVDPDVIFAQDKSYSVPGKFLDGTYKSVAQVYCGKTPCAFSALEWELAPGEEKVLYSMYGGSFKEELIRSCIPRISVKQLRAKQEENREIIRSIKHNALCRSGSEEFNQYVSSCYMDNVMRGGYPYKFNREHSYYIYSRKHGDLERDYNRFKLLPSCFSEGEGNYRDVNQNRRMDLFFNPWIGKKNIVYFLNFLKIDGYNPLVVKGEKLFLRAKDAEALLEKYGIRKSAVLPLMEKGFFLGEFFRFLDEEGIEVNGREELAQELVKTGMREPQADFGEGYWIDHWRYNLDLIESYLYFYPDRADELLRENEFYFWDDEVRVKKRTQRYSVRDGQVYQGESIEHSSEKLDVLKKRRRYTNYLRAEDGSPYRTSLAEKLLTLVLNKAATLDPSGIGIEMEAGKPGWCDSLNGLPALFGSSLCETYELKRTCQFLLWALELLRSQADGIALSEEVNLFFQRLHKLLREYNAQTKKERDFSWWEKANMVKEAFRKDTFFCLSGKRKVQPVQSVKEFLLLLVEKLDAGIQKAKGDDGIPATYFTYKVTQYDQVKQIVTPKKFERHALPLFLEAPVHALRIDREKELYRAVKSSPLFDPQLRLYRLNASLKEEPLEIGRSRIFVPGWLENESIWLHMEYKYLLETVKAGLYEEFYTDFFQACVCFFDPRRYGRNVIENSSFIVSSAYPDKSLWGKGFVARLSGATAELLHIWIYLCMGPAPFQMNASRELELRFAPILHKELFTAADQECEVNGRRERIPAGCFAFKLFSSILVVYHNRGGGNLYPDREAEKITITDSAGTHEICGGRIPAPWSEKVRNVEVSRIDLYFP